MPRRAPAASLAPHLQGWWAAHPGVPSLALRPHRARWRLHSGRHQVCHSQGDGAGGLVPVRVQVVLCVACPLLAVQYVLGSDWWLLLDV